MSSDVLAVVPLRSPGDGKRRLAEVLDRESRAALASAMLADVVAAVTGAGLDVVVAASGPDAVVAAERLGVPVVTDPPGAGSLDGAIAHACNTAGAGRDGLLVVQADLPLLTAADITAVVTAPDAIVIAPTGDGGTSALLRRPPDAIGTAFGQDSAAAHLRLALEAMLPTRVINRPGLAFDLDTVDDLRALLHDDESAAGGAAGEATVSVLRRVALPGPAGRSSPS